MSFAFTITSNTSVLEASYSPAIELDGNYEIGLLLLETFNSIPNITEKNNQFYYKGDKIIEIPTGSYEISDLSRYIKKKIVEEDKEAEFILTGNSNTLRSEIYCSYDIDFSKPNNIASVLGFEGLYEAKKFAASEKPVSIIKVNTIQVICNISSGSYTNNQHSHSIFEFGLSVSPGYRISIAPNKVIYFPITTKTLSNLSLRLVDQNNEEVDFRGEPVVIRVHIRRCR